jgi:ABC-type multidrug transport system fused ATPase/permease subunit
MMAEQPLLPPGTSVMRRGVRVIAGYIAMHPAPFIIAVTSAAVYAAATVASTYVLGRVTDYVLVPAFHGGVGGNALALGCGAIIGVALVRALGIVLRRFFAGMTAARVKRSLQTRLIDSYSVLPLAFHRSRPAGELVAHVESDVDAATNVLHPLPYSSAVVLLITFAAIALILTDPFLAIIGCAVLPILAILNRVFSQTVEGAWTRSQEQVGRVASVAHESIDGALVVKTLGREQAEVDRLATEADLLRLQRTDVGRMRAWFEPAFDALPQIGNILILGVGSWRIATGHITTGTLVQFVSLFQMLAMPIRLLGFLLGDVPRAVVGFTRISDVYDEPRPLAAGRGRQPLPKGPLAVRVEALGFSYGDNRVLDGVDFAIPANETVALVGQTGSGKSTLVDVLVGLEQPASGGVSYNGVGLQQIDPDALRRAVSVVFQESFLFARSVRDNITLGLPATDTEVEWAARLAQAHGFISRLREGYDTVLGERGVTLSGGQRQRIALARALLRRPRVLILDDATSAVDPRVEAAILDGLRRQLSCTLLVVAHRVSTITLADRIVYLEGGRVAATGTHAELMRLPGYYAIVTAYERGAA